MPETKKYLNRDGLEEYNSLLPHSSAEIQEYVDDWLDAHPEATTTVQDGSITTQKLADGSVTRNKLAADVAHLLGGMMVTGEMQGDILSADDAYSVAPLSMEIDGKSTQDGTPTPDAPVPIDSIEVLELPITFVGKNLLDPATLSNGYISVDGTVVGTTATYMHNDYLPITPNVTYRVSQGDVSYSGAIRTAFYDSNKTFIIAYNQNGQLAPAFKAPANAAFMRSSFNGPQSAYAMIEVDTGSFAGFVPYAEITTNIPMQGHVLRSLPDGTHDTMTLSYLRESDRAGWAWYSRELVQRVRNRLVSSLDWSTLSGYEHHFYTVPDDSAIGPAYDIVSLACSALQGVGAKSISDIRNTDPDSMLVCYRSGYLQIFAVAGSNVSGVASFLALMGNAEIQYPLANPITTTLDPIELPVLPAPNCTVRVDPTTGLKMSYMRNANIVISDIEQAIADL